MTEIDVIALYGPGNLKPDDLVAGFVAREKTLDYFLNELRHQAAAGASPRHHLIVGQRGMGKTTLLHRIAIAVGEHNDLNQALLPLTFREEQYNVINLHVFWRNAIESLLDWLERQGCRRTGQDAGTTTGRRRKSLRTKPQWRSRRRCGLASIQLGLRTTGQAAGVVS